LVDHLQQFEPQAPASLVKAEVTLLRPIGEGVIAQNAGALNRDEKKPAKLLAAEQEFRIGLREFGEHQYAAVDAAAGSVLRFLPTPIAAAAGLISAVASRGLDFIRAPNGLIAARGGHIA
jgi:hypothetical protein